MKERALLHKCLIRITSFSRSAINDPHNSPIYSINASHFDTTLVVGDAGDEQSAEQEEFLPVVSFRRHTDETFQQEEEEEQENADEEEEPEALQGKARRGRPKKKPTVELPKPPEFVPLPRTEHRAGVRLPVELDLGTPAPISLFRLFFTDKILNTIVNSTNLYAISKDASSAGRAWQPIDSDQLVTWIALTVYIGLHRMSRFDSCWSTNKQEPIHMISQYMKKIRYQQIKRYLHVSVPEATIINYFDKLEPLLSHVRDMSKKLYTLATNVSVDEMIIRFSGRSAHTVRMKNKPTPEGFKIFSLCDSGYTYTFLPTSRIAPVQIEKVDGLTQTGSIVNHLTQQLPHSRLNFNIYMDNFFTSTKLFQHFRNIGIGACGTARRQAGIPKELQVDKTSKLEWDTRSGAVIGGVLAVFWQDNGPVMMMTTIHGMVGEQWEVTREWRRPRDTSTNGAKVRSVFGDSPRKELKILKVVDDYNHHMGGVDIADQLHSYYSTQQIARRNWMPLFFWILDTVIVNCYLIAREKGSLLTHREFRQTLVWELIRAVHQRNKSMRSDVDQEDEGARKRTQREKVTKHFQLPDFRFAPGIHYPEWRATRATCQWCSWRSLKKQIFMDHKNPCQSQFWCIECDVPLCLNKTRSCFKDYHSP